MKTKLVVTLISSALLIAGCGSKSEDAAKAPAAGGLADLKSPAAVQAATANTSKRGDASKPLTEYREISGGNDLMFLYYAQLGIPVDYDKVAQIYSEDYRRTSDTFKKQDIVNALKPRIDSQIEAARSGRYVIWTIDSPYNSLLSSYRMETKSFPVQQLTADAFYYFTDNASGYHISFANAEDFKSLTVPDEGKARAIEAMVSKNVGMRMRIYAFVQDADPSNTTVKAQIMKIKISGKNGESIWD